MFSSDTPEVLLALILFWVLLPFVVWAPVKWSVLAWLVMGNLDATGPGFASADSVGWVNAMKGVGIPLLFCWRLRDYPSTALFSLPSKLWIALATYASIASIWSPFPIAGVKLVGNMVGALLTIVVLEKAARAKMLNSNVLTLLIAFSLLLGVVQTYLFDGTLYGYDGPDQPTRFSSFVSAQQYAAILVAFLAIALWTQEFSATRRSLLIGSITAALALNGSRTWFIGAAFVLLVYSWICFRRVAVGIVFAAGTACLGVLLFLNLSQSGIDSSGEAPGRIVATANALVSGTDTAQRAGLRNLSFRFIVHEGVLEELRSGNLTQTLFGHGTSSGGALVLRIFPAVYNADRLDANRAIHDEWLRALYEWGISGLLLLSGVFGCLTIGLINQYRRANWKPPSAALLSFLPAFLAALATENILAGAGNAVTFGLAILVGLLWAPQPGRVRTPFRSSHRELAPTFGRIDDNPRCA